ncbi:MAG: carbohydrate porin [Deltaproteobacteria bacterium]|nr:carbohydrate porin [Deltaproteobacteria bacterium]
MALLLVGGLACVVLPAADGAAEQRVSVPSDPNAPGFPDEIGIDGPGSIADQYALDRQRSEYLFNLPAVDSLLEPWSALRERLDKQYGFKPTLSFTHIYQWASDAEGPEDDASGFELVMDGTWTPLGRDTGSPSTLGFEVLWRDRMGTDIPPVALFGSVGSLYPTTVAFGEIGPSLGQLWVQQIFDHRVGFRIGKFFPVPAYDYFPLKNFRTDFVDGTHAANVVIPLPDRGLGLLGVYRPQPNVYIRVGIHDANADAERSGFNSIDEKEFFKIIEVGVDPGLAERQPGKPPPGDVHLSVWQQDERDDDDINNGWGFVLSGSQRFGRFLPFLRYGYSDSGRRGPSSIAHMVNGGVAIDDVFGQSNDRIGIGVTWSRPAVDSLDDQETVDLFYRVQVTPRIAVTPLVQFIVDPVRNSRDTVWVLGIRTRFAF